MDLESQVNLNPLRIEDRDWLGATPLMWASRISNSAHTNILLSRGAKIEARDSSGRTALHYAVQGGSLGCIKAFLEVEADARTADYHGLAPLHNVIYFTDKRKVGDIISCLCAYGADLEAGKNMGFMPLYRAVDLGSYVSAEALIRCGADVNILGIDNYPPIERAILHDFEDIVELLCQAGTMVSCIDCYGRERDAASDAVLYGMLRVMDAISGSDTAPVECNATQLRYWIDTRQDRLLSGFLRRWFH